MTLPPWEEGPEFTPPPPQVSALAQTLARLTQACWASGRAERTTLSRGLTVTAFLVDDDLQLALTRADSEPSEEEAEIVAREAGWAGYEQVWKQGGSGRRGLVLTRSSGRPAVVASPDVLPPDPCKAIRALLIAKRDKNRRMPADLTQDEWDRARGSPFPQADVISLLTRHTDPSYTPSLADGARAARTGYLKGLGVPALLEELDGYWSHWPGRRQGLLELENVMNLPIP